MSLERLGVIIISKLQMNLRRKVPFMIVPNRIKYLEIHVKEMQDLYMKK